MIFVDERKCTLACGQSRGESIDACRRVGGAIAQDLDSLARASTHIQLRSSRFSIWRGRQLAGARRGHPWPSR